MPMIYILQTDCVLPVDKICKIFYIAQALTREIGGVWQFIVFVWLIPYPIRN